MSARRAPYLVQVVARLVVATAVVVLFGLGAGYAPLALAGVLFLILAFVTRRERRTPPRAAP